MFREYALEPQVVATWAADRESYRYFREQFGIGRPRVITEFPVGWESEVQKAAESLSGGKDATRLEILLRRIKEVSVARKDALYDLSHAWLPNAQAEHRRVPFHAIVARENETGTDCVIRASDLDEDNPLWKGRSGIVLERKAGVIASELGVLLRSAKHLYFVDPFLSPSGSQRRLTALKELLRVVGHRPTGRQPLTIEVQINGERCGGPRGAFADDCERLARSIPAGLEVRFVRLQERPGGQRLHNRYILTNLGGVQFGHGLDEGDEGEDDDLNLLDLDQYNQRWTQYTGQPSAFDHFGEPVEIIGCHRPRQDGTRTPLST